MTIPARAITRPESRTLEMLSREYGLFNQLQEPFALRRLPFRLDENSMTGPGVEEAMEVLAALAPASTNWLASKLLDVGGGRGVWRVSGRWIEATTSRRLDAEPLVDRSTPVWYATIGLPRLPDGMHSITTGGRRTLLRRQP